MWSRWKPKGWRGNLAAIVYRISREVVPGLVPRCEVGIRVSIYVAAPWSASSDRSGMTKFRTFGYSLLWGNRPANTRFRGRRHAGIP